MKAAPAADLHASGCTMHGGLGILGMEDRAYYA